MQIDVNLSVNKNLLDNNMDVNSSNIANGWVEIENAFKFPVQILKTTKDGQERMFVKFPAKKNADNTYSNTVFPVDKEVKAAIEEKVMETFKKEITKGVVNPQISEVKVTMLPETEASLNQKVVSKAMANIKICGIAINGFVIKESEKGLFVQMPQYKDGAGQFHETFYGTNKMMQLQITNTILEEYDKVLKKNEVKQLANAEPELTPKV